MPLSENMRGALLMTLSMAAFTTNDSMMKGVLEELPLFQALFLRGVLNLVMVLTVLRPFLGPVRFDLPRRDLWLIALRSLSEVGGAICFMSAVRAIPFANATAIMQTMPLSITLLGALLFRDPLGWRRLLSIGVGFVGVLLIVKPGTAGFELEGLWALAAMICITLRDTTVRAMGRDVPNSTVTFAAVLAVTVATGFVSIQEPWQSLSPLSSLQLIGAASCLLVGYVTSVTVMRIGEISFVSPFRYTALIWALLLGFVAFGEWPDDWALVGAGVIALSGIYNVLREARLRRRAARAGRA